MARRAARQDPARAARRRAGAPSAIPQGRYYGTVDATPLFLILIGQHAAWTGDLRLFTNCAATCRARPRLDRIMATRAAGATSPTRAPPTRAWSTRAGRLRQRDRQRRRQPGRSADCAGRGAGLRLPGPLEHRRALRAQRRARRAQQLRRKPASCANASTATSGWKTRASSPWPCKPVAPGPRGRPSNPGQALWTGIVDPTRRTGRPASSCGRRHVQRLGRPHPVEQEKPLSPDQLPPRNRLAPRQLPDRRRAPALSLQRPGRRIFTGIAEAALQFPRTGCPTVHRACAGRISAPGPLPGGLPPASLGRALPFLLETMLGLPPDAFAHRLRVRRTWLPSIAQ